jgi:hypothetical protein
MRSRGSRRARASAQPVDEALAVLSGEPVDETRLEVPLEPHLRRFGPDGVGHVREAAPEGRAVRDVGERAPPGRRPERVEVVVVLAARVGPCGEQELDDLELAIMCTGRARAA